MTVAGHDGPIPADEIADVPCLRCGEPSDQQWNICALGGRHYGVCLDCDIALNRTVLAFMRTPDLTAIMAAYEAKMRR